MEQTRKRGRPKLYLTREMVEERKVLKRLCKNSRRNLQDDQRCRLEGEAASMDERGAGDLPQSNNENPAVEKINKNKSANENPGTSSMGGGKSHWGMSAAAGHCRKEEDVPRKQFDTGSW
ncbi:uncharacterized protein LOC141667201 isoform X4 [Apium graveolens]|uniref:uncharacterized protein LOC141667201 isoform X4 n=1 Tax=Apium graveolens TaxID=4045 RepID=UPI003D7AC410